MKKSKKIKLILFVLIYLSILGMIVAQDTLNQKSIFNSLYREDCIEITLQSDFNNLIENKRRVNYQSAWISYTDNEGKEIKQRIQIRARGKSRRRICDIPPILMNFSRDNPSALKITGAQKLKLVTHCFEKQNKKGQQNIIKEFLAYKLLNILTEKSFRVQLVQITYLDSQTDESSKRYGFIIEDARSLAKRLQTSQVKKYNLSVEALDKEQYNTVALFQYMISNTDWKIDMLHNVKVFSSNKGSMVIPYDFDYSGIVNTGYAKVDPNYDQEHINDRIFLGRFYTEKELNATIDLFKSKKEEMIRYCENVPALTKRNRRYVLSQINFFHKQIEKERFIRREFL